MDYVNLGRTGLEVSRICLGCLTFGGQADEKESQRIVDTAWDAGINFFDTANVYTETLSERYLGKALKSQAARVRRMKDAGRALRYLEGWTIFHNHLGGHVSPEGRTPGDASGMDVPVSSWEDVVRLGPPA